MSEDLFLVAQIAGRTVAIRSDQVESVVDIGAITPVPRAAAHVRGLAALRSKVVTVIDTPAALGLGTTRDPQRAVIVGVEGHNYALLVDALEDIVPLALKPVASGVPLDANWSAVGVGIVERAGEPILAIDLAPLPLASRITH